MKRRPCALWTAGLCALFASHGAEPNRYANPVIATPQLADPTIVRHGGRYYLYATESPDRAYFAWTSTDLVHWARGPEVFRPGRRGVWAPDVYFHPEDRKFYLYYTVREQVGVAVADKPEGPFVDRGVLHTGSIDAHLFRDDDRRLYLYFVRLGPFRIMAQRMKDPLTPAGEPAKVIEPTEPWEKKSGEVTEGPWMVKHKGVYYLLYSGTGADSPDYGIGYATAAGPLGPFRKFEGNPILHRSNTVFGPGHGCAVTDGAGALWFVYHQKITDDRSWPRFVCLDRLEFDARGRLGGRATRGIPLPAPAPIKD